MVRPELEGILSSSTDLNQVRKHVIDLRTRSITTTAYPDPDGDGFVHGINLLPPLQVLPYRPDGDARGHELQRCVARLDSTVWVTGGHLPCTMDQRVFDIFYRARVLGRDEPRRLVPINEYLRRVNDPAHTVRMFRLDRDLKLESEHVFPAGWFMGAPIFVPREGAATLRDGWLVGQAWGPDAPHMQLWVWDAARPLSDGPVVKLGPRHAGRSAAAGLPAALIMDRRRGHSRVGATVVRGPDAGGVALGEGAGADDRGGDGALALGAAAAAGVVAIGERGSG